MPIGVAVGVASAILLVAKFGDGDGSSALRGKGSDNLEEFDEVDGEGGAVNEGFKEEVDDEPKGLNRESPESFCNGGSVPIDDPSPDPPSE